MNARFRISNDPEFELRDGKMVNTSEVTFVCTRPGMMEPIDGVGLALPDEPIEFRIYEKPARQKLTLEKFEAELDSQLTDLEVLAEKAPREWSEKMHGPLVDLRVILEQVSEEVENGGKEEKVPD